MIIKIDNQAAIENKASSGLARHAAAKLKRVYVHTNDNLASLKTKALAEPRLAELRTSVLAQVLWQRYLGGVSEANVAHCFQCNFTRYMAPGISSKCSSQEDSSTNCAVVNRPMSAQERQGDESRRGIRSHLMQRHISVDEWDADCATSRQYISALVETPELKV